MKNKFTLENTMDATHVYFIENGGGYQFANRYGYINESSDHMSNSQSGDVPESIEGCYDISGYDLNLTDQTGRGYPTLKWFLKCGRLVEVNDIVCLINGDEHVVSVAGVDDWNDRDSSDDKYYVKSLHDNRHDLTAMARDEYYSKREKQWPAEEESARMISIGQNGNNGEHYESKPVYTQEMHDNGELPPVGSECLVKKYFEDDAQFQLCFIVGFDKNPEWLVFSGMGSNLNSHHIGDGVYRFKPIDTRTDDEKLRDALVKQLTSKGDMHNQFAAARDAVGWLMESNKFTITLNEEG